MKVLRRIGRKGAGGIAAAGVLVGLMMFVVLPAIASTPGSPVPPASSPDSVTPTDVQTGGQDNDCSLFYPGGSTLHAFYIDNPKSKSYTDPATGAIFTLTVNPTPSTGWPAAANGKYLSFTTTGAAVVDVGINGGNDTTHYNYSRYLGQQYGFTRSDGFLHAGAQSVNSNGNPTQLYSYSHLAFCYGTSGVASGALFDDTTHNGVKDTGEGGLPNKTVRLYSGTNLAGSAVSGADGSYQLGTLTPGSTYRVCVVGTGSKETVPTTATPNSAACTGSGESQVGYTATANTNLMGLNFGLAAVASISGTAFFDTNGDSANNTGDSPAGGLTVTLYSGSGTSLASTATTAGDGTYSFADQFINNTYRVCISKPADETYNSRPVVRSGVHGRRPGAQRVQLHARLRRAGRLRLRLRTVGVCLRHGLQRPEPGRRQQRRCAAAGLDRESLRGLEPGQDDHRRPRTARTASRCRSRRAPRTRSARHRRPAPGGRASRCPRRRPCATAGTSRRGTRSHRRCRGRS